MIPLSVNNSDSTNWNTVNNALRRLENEQVTKAFKQPGGNSILEGRLPSDTYGIQMNDSENVPKILLGFSPDDGRPILAITADEYDVIDELGG